MQDILNVYFFDKFVGQLYKKDFVLCFKYDEEYLSSENPRELSASLCLSEDEYKGQVVEGYFSNLLPDEDKRKEVASIHKISKENTLGLLYKIGGDCAGAVSLYPVDVAPEFDGLDEYELLSADKRNEILLNLHRIPLGTGDEDFRISGSGAQDKLIARVKDGNIYLPLRGTPSTDIIKPNIKDHNKVWDSVFNEFFCMNLAKECGLEVPKSYIIYWDDIPYYVVERYDRFIDKDDNVSRIHQEDFCQALSIDPEKKYESEGGPTLKDCYDLLVSIGVPANDKIRFLDMIIFNYMIGNGDAHGKNFSIIYRERLPNVSPCYDVLSDAVYYEDISKHKMAMKLGGQKYFSSKVKIENFDKLALDLGIKPDLLRKRISLMCGVIVKKAEDLKEKYNSNEKTKSDIYDKIIKIINRNVNRMS